MGTTWDGDTVSLCMPDLCEGHGGKKRLTAGFAAAFAGAAISSLCLFFSGSKREVLSFAESLEATLLESPSSASLSSSSWSCARFCFFFGEEGCSL